MENSSSIAPPLSHHRRPRSPRKTLALSQLTPEPERCTFLRIGIVSLRRSPFSGEWFLKGKENSTEERAGEKVVRRTRSRTWVCAEQGYPGPSCSETCVLGKDTIATPTTSLSTSTKVRLGKQRKKFRALRGMTEQAGLLAFKFF